MFGSSSVAAQLAASQDGLNTMKLVMDQTPSWEAESLSPNFATLSLHKPATEPYPNRLCVLFLKNHF
jgi:hypothetical protein